jgi:hypothetical protein
MYYYYAKRKGKERKEKIKDEQPGEKIANDANTIRGQRDVQYNMG